MDIYTVRKYLQVINQIHNGSTSLHLSKELNVSRRQAQKMINKLLDLGLIKGYRNYELTEEGTYYTMAIMSEGF